MTAGALALAWFGKEWRGQRGLLGAYMALVLPSLMLVFALLPDDFWLHDGNRAHALAWFFAAGVIGAVLFAAPQLVRGEFTSKDDQLVRRLPAGLGAAFAGKLVYLVAVCLLLPLVGLLVGEIYLAGTGSGFADLFVVCHRDHVAIVRWPFVAVVAIGALLLPAWVWAVGTWLPGGRMAVGGTALLGLLVGLGAVAVLRQSPGLGRTLGDASWFAALWPCGLLVTWVAWVRGRRGGGPRRSARLGLVATGLVLLPPAGWLGMQAFRYHHPDLQRLVDLRVEGVSPDGRFALVRGAGHGEWMSVPVRVDLQTGAAEQLGSAWTWAGREVQRPFVAGPLPRQRYWRVLDTDEGRQGVLDLQTGLRHPLPDVGPEGSADPVVPAALRSPLAADRRASSPFRLPGGRRAWLVEDQLAVELPGGGVARHVWPEELRRGLVRPAGHGIEVVSRDYRWFDPELGQLVAPPEGRVERGFSLRGRWFFRRQQRRGDALWLTRDAGGWQPVAALADASFVGLLDDDRAMFVSRGGGVRPVALLLLPADGSACERVPLPLPAGGKLLALHAVGTLHGEAWLRGTVQGHGSVYFAVDLATVSVRRPPIDDVDVLALLDDAPGEGAVLAVEDRRRIVRIALPSGEVTQLFPRPEAP